MTRKSLIFLFLSALLYTSSVNAQKHTVGVFGGMVSSGMAMDFKGTTDPKDKAPEFDRITNFYFSVSYGYNFLGKLHFNSGVDFYNKGSMIRYDTGSVDTWGGGTYHYKTNTSEILSYLSVPISIARHIHLDKNGRHRIILCAGTNFSYLLRSTVEGTSIVDYTPPGQTEAESSETRKIDPIRTSGYNKWDFSVHFGGGYRFQLNDNLGFGLDYRYLSNFNNINDERLSFQKYDNLKSKFYSYSPKMMNQDNHVLSVGIFMSPRLFLGLEK